MKVIVTGAAGFIGSHVCDTLLSHGHSVWGIDNFNDYYNPDQKWNNIHDARGEKRFQLIYSDIRDRSLIQNLFSQVKPDSVIHLAAMAGVRRSVEQPEYYVDVNINGTQSILDAARLCKSKPQLVLASTSSVYGLTDQIPFLESNQEVIPIQPYSATKRATEIMAQTYHNLYDVSSTVVRFFTVYGPRGRPDMMPMLLAESISNQSEIPYYGSAMERDWTFVEDIVQGVIKAAETPLGFEILNLGRGEPVRLRTFIDILEKIAGARAVLQEQEKPAADVYRTWADCSKAKTLIGYSPKVSVEEGISRFWDWYKTAKGLS